MKDATRQEAIQWCINNKCDFLSPVFPPPEGWQWAKSEGLCLTPIFTITDQGDEIEFQEVYPERRLGVWSAKDPNPQNLPRK
jgi:hypothetical protein